MHQSSYALTPAQLQANGRIGKLKVIWGNKRLLGPDKCYLLIAFLLIIIPSIWFMWSQLPMYGDIMLILLTETIFLVSTFINWYSLYSVGTSDPGVIPASTSKVNTRYEYFIEPRKAGIGIIKLKVCHSWNIIRPPRSFHCHKCNWCIEVQDHHWPWTGTWIGRRTHVKFILFLISTSIHALVAVILNIYPFILTKKEDPEDIFMLNSVMWMGFAGSFVIWMFWFAIYHLFLASQNITTNESVRGVYKRDPNPFDYGLSTNMRIFSQIYPNTPSSIFDTLLETSHNEEECYYRILTRYGKLFMREARKIKFTSTQDNEESKSFL